MVTLPGRKVGRSAWRAARVLFALAAGLLVAELALRALAPRHAGLRAMLYHPAVLGPFEEARTTGELLSLSPGGYRPSDIVMNFIHNSRGFRTPEYSEERVPGVARVVVLGDSFAYSSGPVPYDGHWTRVLELGLSDRLGIPVEVVNLGVSAIGPSFELRLWQLEGRRLRPDLVVLAFFVGNDFTDHTEAAAAPGLAGALVRQSLAARLARNLWRATRARPPRRPSAKPPDLPPGTPTGIPLARLYPNAPEYDRDWPAMSEEAFLDVERRRLAICHQGGALLARTAAHVGPVLAELAASVRAAGSELAVLAIPDVYQVHDEILVRAVEKEPGLRAEALDLGAPQRVLHEILEPEGVAVLDLLPVFRPYAGEHRLYGVNDTHWNLAGNRLAGVAATEFLAPLLSARLPPSDGRREPRAKSGAALGAARGEE